MNRFVIYSSLWLLDMYILSKLGPAGRVPVPFALAYVGGFICMFLMMRSCPPQWSNRRILFAVIGTGIIGRLFFLGYPVSNDVYRYIWEGYIQNHGFNPYVHAPIDPILSTLRDGDLKTIWESINHKDLSGAYPPLVMLLFRNLSGVSPTPLLFQSTMLFFDLITIVFLLLFIHRYDLPRPQLLLYTANPFILVYAVGEAHLDIIQAACLISGLYCLSLRKNWSGFFLLGAAVFSKYLAIVALPFVIKRANLRYLGAAVLTGIVVLPFASDIGALFHSLGIFGTTMHYNDGLAELVRFFVGDYSVILLIGLLLAILLLIYLIEHEMMRSVYLAIGVLLLFLPTLHPWYLLLIAPFMVIYPSRAWLYLMGATIVTLPVVAIEYQTGVFQEIKLLKLIEYLPFFSLLIYDFLTHRPYPTVKKIQYPRAESVSVIMPTLNEGKHIAETLSTLQRHAAVRDVIIVDGGSSDATREIARTAGAVVMSSKPGRGYQVEIGIKKANGDVILVLHADTAIEQSTISRMLEHLNAQPSIPGGAFGMSFSSRSAKLRVITLLNNLRAKWLGVSFGDQAQFFRRKALDHLGGYPAMMLMEDVELSMRMKKFGRPLFVPSGVMVSPRGWEKKGFSGNVVLVVSLFLRYLFERRLCGDNLVTSWYYNKYYGRSYKS